jgi:antitoxin (DNA-binding transcriptional repressor) of toxin-antitoxin stability system
LYAISGVKSISLSLDMQASCLSTVLIAVAVLAEFDIFLKIGHNIVIMKSKLKKEETAVSTATLKAELAKYLRLVEAGNEVVVLNHKTAVAKIIPFSGETLGPLETKKARGEFSDLAQMEIPKHKKKGKADSLALLLEERGSR